MQDTARNVTELACPMGDGEAAVTIDVPSNTSFILINGTVGPDRGFPTYRWDPKPPGAQYSEWKGGNADRPWVSGQPLYAQRLDPDVNYTLAVTQSPLGSVYLDTVTFYSANG